MEEIRHGRTWEKAINAGAKRGDHIDDQEIPSYHLDEGL